MPNEVPVPNAALYLALGIWHLAFVLAGCDDGADQHSDKELAALHKQCNELTARAKLAAEKAEADRRSLVAADDKQLAATTQQEEVLGRDLDHIRDSVQAAFTADGRVFRSDDYDRRRVAKLVDEFVAKFKTQKDDYHSLKLETEELQEDVKELREAPRAGRAAAARTRHQVRRPELGSLSPP